MGDILVLSVLGLAVFLAIRSMAAKKKSGACSCGGGCSGCSGCCPSPKKGE